MLTRVFLSFTYLKDIKSLQGFVRGGKDKVPKELSDYSSSLIATWAEHEIKEHIESVATKSKVNLDISARDFNTPSYHKETGGFFCKTFNYDFSVGQTEHDFSKCMFTGVLEVKDVKMFKEVKDVIDNCFNFSFEDISCKLPENQRDLKELIYSLDDNKKLFNSVYDFTYENDFSSCKLIHKKEQQKIIVDSKEIKIQFKNSEPTYKMIAALEEVNNKILLASSPPNQLTN